MQQDFFSDHIDRAIQILRDLEPEDGYYLAFSGGKDSVCIYHLAVMAGVRFDAHYSLTTVDPPDLVHFIRREYPDVIFDLPVTTMWDLIIKKGFPPTRIMRFCCTVLKEGGGAGRFVLTGVRAAESPRRSKRKQVEICTQRKGRRFLHPIFEWSDAEVWGFIKNENISYCSLYDEGYKRLGCIGCPMCGDKVMFADFTRWPKYREQYMRTFQRMQDKRKIEGKKPVGTDYTAEAAMHWWLYGADKKDDAQEMLFE